MVWSLMLTGKSSVGSDLKSRQFSAVPVYLEYDLLVGWERQ